jgi:hypothetical protein
VDDEIHKNAGAYLFKLMPAERFLEKSTADSRFSGFSALILLYSGNFD